ncbi:MAG: dihydropteroate synthase [Acidimicrobiales bacterium]
MRLGERVYDLTEHALVMGILGAPPDVDALLRAATQLVADGADLLEVGGGDSRCCDPEGLVTAVGALRERFDVPLAVVSGSGAVARAGFRAGAVMACSWGGCARDVLAAVAGAGATVVLGSGGASGGAAGGGGAEAEEVIAAIAAGARRAEEAGVAGDRIVLDPGLDLRRAPGYSRALLRAGPASRRLVGLGYPVVLTAGAAGASPIPAEAGPAAAAAAGASPIPAEAALGVVLGCRIVRTEDVLGARHACDVIAAILEAEPREARASVVLGAHR